MGNLIALMSQLGRGVAFLAPLGARRLDRRALCRGDCQDSAGKDVAVESLAVLAIGDIKIGITTERITGAFCRLATERSSL